MPWVLVRSSHPDPIQRQIVYATQHSPAAGNTELQVSTVPGARNTLGWRQFETKQVRLNTWFVDCVRIMANLHGVAVVYGQRLRVHHFVRLNLTCMPKLDAQGCYNYVCTAIAKCGDWWNSTGLSRGRGIGGSENGSCVSTGSTSMTFPTPQTTLA